MYDSGGISLKPTDPMHAAMKMDMSGAAAVLSAMSAVPNSRCPLWLKFINRGVGQEAKEDWGR